MACNSCSSGSNGQPKGCKNNGTCGTDGCNKLTVFDWLANMELAEGEVPFDWVEIRFKNSRKEFFKNTESLPLKIGDVVASEAEFGHDIGTVTLTGQLVKVQMQRKKAPFDDQTEVQKIYRIATQKDIYKWIDLRNKEEAMQVRARQIAIDLNLKMKISDLEFQGDGSKITFFYTANQRVDFRELIKIFAKEFSTRIEMRQVGLRQEAARLGGIGSCGRELCCSTWLTDFRSVSTSAARYQQLSLNPQKLAGQCGKLKCCLNFELDSYMEALKAFPSTDVKLLTEKGEAVCQKSDIFKGIMWYAYKGDWITWFPLEVADVATIVELNKNGLKAESLEAYVVVQESSPQVEFASVLGQDSLTRFDVKRRSNKGKSRRRPRNKNDK
ncbi:MAG: regulatory iron-sulfur-containing complex subunit RicT [Bacteroidetes bacterium]|nr:regulatory iron-sulfur-containing complex subunit RicT [Bacteroidota bacterium]MDA0878995.1 regulatory iron-sulfur-containing complex subunit RicT [Bacteroidota bacterium]MDA1115902.1 regulatory iron-sulfur-containing complex subunit RicT [Bacteroidota bacterium]